MKGKIDFESEPWPSISDSAKDLIKKMLQRDPRQRITAHQVLCKSDFVLKLGGQDYMGVFCFIVHTCQLRD